MSAWRLLVWFGLLLICGPFDSLAQQATLLEVENIVQTAKSGGTWAPAAAGQPLALKDRIRTRQRSRATVKLTDLYTLRLDQFTTIEIAPALLGAEKPQLNISAGTAFIFSREPSGEIDIKTPAANGALRGTQLIVRVTPLAKTLMTVLEGKVNLSNALGSVLLETGESGEAEIGKPPRKTAVIEAVNILQWALYYPGVLDSRELGLEAGEEAAVAASIAAYREGDLLGALEKYPADHRPRSDAGRMYYAGVLLAVGRVDDARRRSRQ